MVVKADNMALGIMKIPVPGNFLYRLLTVLLTKLAYLRASIVSLYETRVFELVYRYIMLRVCSKRLSSKAYT